MPENNESTRIYQDLENFNAALERGENARMEMEPIDEPATLAAIQQRSIDTMTHKRAAIILANFIEQYQNGESGTPVDLVSMLLLVQIQKWLFKQAIKNGEQ